MRCARYACQRAARPGKKSCSPCAKQMRERQRAIYARCKQDGVCWRCGAPAFRSLYCQSHWEDMLEYRRASRADPANRHCVLCKATGHLKKDHARLGLCIWCREPGGERYARRGPFCSVHFAEARRSIIASSCRRAALDRQVRGSVGICERCGKREKAEQSASRCAECLSYAAEKQRQYYERHARRGAA